MDRIFDSGAAYALGRINGDTWSVIAVFMCSAPNEENRM